MDVLAYWKWENYIQDIAKKQDFDFNSNQQRLHSEIGIGDNLWLVTGRRDKHPTQYVLVGRFRIREKALNNADHKYGIYRVLGDALNSQYFSLDAPDLSEVLLQLQFSSSTPIKSKGVIGNSLQTMRVLTPNDVALLQEWATKLDPLL